MRLRVLHAATSLTPHLTRRAEPAGAGRSSRENRRPAMRRSVVAMVLLGVGCAAPPRTAPAPSAAAAAPMGMVTAEELRRDVYAFADDSMQGRETGSEGASRA